MSINISSRNFELTGDIKNSVYESFEEFEKYSANIIEAEVVIGAKSPTELYVEYVIRATSGLTTYKERGVDVFKIIKKVTEKVSNKFRRENEKKNTPKKKQNSNGRNSYYEEFDDFDKDYYDQD
jgi:ribosomal subunit interface protein